MRKIVATLVLLAGLTALAAEAMAECRWPYVYRCVPIYGGKVVCGCY